MHMGLYNRVLTLTMVILVFFAMLAFSAVAASNKKECRMAMVPLQSHTNHSWLLKPEVFNNLSSVGQYTALMLNGQPSTINKATC